DRLEPRPRVARRDPRDGAVALRPRPRLEPLVRRRDDGARLARRPGGARPADRLRRPPLGLHRRRARARRRRRLHGGGIRPARGARRGAGCAARPVDPAGTIRRRRTPCPPFLRMKTYSAKPGEIARDWYIVDAEGKTLGRLATQLADVLRGKGKP